MWDNISDPHRDPRRHKFQITRFTLAGKARSFHCASVSKRDPLRWARVWSKDHRTGRSAFPPGFLLPFTRLYDLPQDTAHGLGGLVLLLPRGVGVGAQGEPGVIVPQHGGHRFDVHAVLEGCSGKGVPEIWICQAQTNII